MVKLCAAQAAFVASVHTAVDAEGSAYFDDKDWRSVVPASAGRSNSLTTKKLVKTESYYVRPVAVWVPHLLLNHIPTCPNCESNQHIRIDLSTWIASPIVLFTMKGHQYLDTFLYYCGKCDRRFNGYHKKSMHLDAPAYIGYFNYFLGVKGYAVDEELHSYIVNAAAHQSTASVRERLFNICHDKYLHDFQHYLHAVGANKVMLEKPD